MLLKLEKETMLNGTNSSKNTVFTGKNWPEYRQKTRAYALANKMTGILDGTDIATNYTLPADKKEHAEFVERQQQLYFYLISTQSSETLATLADITEGDSLAIWTRLLQQYESTTKASLKQLMFQLVDLRQGNKSAAEFVSTVLQLKRRIKEITTSSRTDVLDVICMMSLIQGLPQNMSILKSQLFLDENLTLERATRSILDYTELKRIDSGPTVNRVKNAKSKEFCAHCKKAGHSLEKCFIAHPELRPNKGKKTKPDSNTANVAVSADNGFTDEHWRRSVRSAKYVRNDSPPDGFMRFVVDSGATDHFARSNDGLDNFRPHRISVSVADGRTNQSEGIGDISGKIRNIHVMESFHDNLLSVPQLYEEGKVCLFSPTIGGVMIADAKDFTFSCEKRDVTGQYLNGSFIVDVKTTSKQSDAKVAKKAQEVALEALPPVSPKREFKVDLWFKRLGYQNPDRIITGLKNGIFTGVDLPANVMREEFHVDDSDAYQAGRQKAAPHRDRHGEKRSDIPWEVIHFDIKTMDQEDYAGHRYFAIIVDDYSRYKEIFLLKRKSQLVDYLRQFTQQEIVSIGYKIRRVRCDNGGEQKSYEFDEFLTEIAAKVEYTNAYSSASNGISERAIQTVTNTQQCLRIGANLPKAAWGELTKTAAFLENMMPNLANPDRKSAFEMIKGKPPNLSYLRVIGAKAHVHVHKPNRLALDPKTERGHLIGYATKTNGYRILMDRRTGRIVETAHVTFSESSRDLGMLMSMPGPESTSEFFLPDEFSTVPVAGGRSGPTVQETPNNEENDPTDNIGHGGDAVLMADHYGDVGVQTAEGAGNDANNEHLIIPEELVPLLDPNLVQNHVIVKPRSARDRRPPEILTYDQSHMKPKTSRLAHIARVASSRCLSTKITHSQALKDPRLRKSMLDEITHLFSIGAVKVGKLPEGHKAIDCMWAHKFKYDNDGNFLRAKSRLCPKGFQQVPGVSYDPDKVEAPTLRVETVMLMLSIEVNRSMHSSMKDFVGAFSRTPNPDEVYMTPPKGLKLKEGEVLIAQHAINGLKQAAYYWNESIDKVLLSMGFVKSILDPCLYSRWQGSSLSLIGLYVDDLRIVCDQKDDIALIEKKLNEHLPTQAPPEDQWLGMRVTHDRVEGTIRISMGKYIDELLKTFQMEGCHPVSTPATPGSKLLTPEKAENVTFPYREAVGSLLWLGRTARPDILYAVGQLCSHVGNYDHTHVEAVKRVLRYLKGTRDLELTLRRSNDFVLEVYADADFAGEPEGNKGSMRSLSGMVAYVKGVGPIYSQSKLQTTVSTSTAEAEMKAVGLATQFTIALRQLLSEIGFQPTKPTVIHNDNAACIASLKSKLSGSKLRHVKINFHFVKERIASDDIEVRYCPTTEMIADILTKALDKQRFLYLRDLLMNVIGEGDEGDGKARVTFAPIDDEGIVTADATRHGGVSEYVS